MVRIVPGSHIRYGPGEPVIGNPIQTQSPNPGHAAYSASPPNVDIARYIDQSVGGEVASDINTGYSGGLSNSWHGAPFTGETVTFYRENVADYTGPVGRDNRTTRLQAGIKQNLTVPPTQESIYASIMGGLNNGE